MLRSGLQVDVRAVPDESYGAALLYFTGSKAHNIALRGLANQHGWKLNEYGLFSGKRRIAGATEEDVYQRLGSLHCAGVARRPRRNRGSRRPASCPRLVKLSDIRGDLHVHSDWTDGTVAIAGMAEAAQARGYEYIALTDHSRRVAMTHGLDPTHLARQIHEIDRLNDKLKNFTILKGIEVDILKEAVLICPIQVWRSWISWSLRCIRISICRARRRPTASSAPWRTAMCPFWRIRPGA